MNYPVQKNTLYVGGLAEEVNEVILHAAFIPFGDIKDVKTPLDQATQKHRSFGFVTFLEREDAAAAMDNMDGAELYGRVLTVNYALPERIKGGEQGWAAQPSMFPFPFSLLLLISPIQFLDRCFGKTLILALHFSIQVSGFLGVNVVVVVRLALGQYVYLVLIEVWPFKVLALLTSHWEQYDYMRDFPLLASW